MQSLAPQQIAVAVTRARSAAKAAWTATRTAAVANVVHGQ